VLRPFLCFRACVVHFLQVMQEEIGPRGTGTLNVVLESGHRHVGDADRIFAEMQASIRVHFGVATKATAWFLRKLWRTACR
jgi:hypothetical protein